MGVPPQFERYRAHLYTAESSSLLRPVISPGPDAASLRSGSGLSRYGLWAAGAVWSPGSSLYSGNVELDGLDGRSPEESLFLFLHQREMPPIAPWTGPPEVLRLDFRAVKPGKPVDFLRARKVDLQGRGESALVDVSPNMKGVSLIPLRWELRSDASLAGRVFERNLLTGKGEYGTSSSSSSPQISCRSCQRGLGSEGKKDVFLRTEPDEADGASGNGFGLLRRALSGSGLSKVLYV